MDEIENLKIFSLNIQGNFKGIVTRLAVFLATYNITPSQNKLRAKLRV